MCAQINKYLILNVDVRIRDLRIDEYSISYKDILRSYVTQAFYYNRKLSSYIEFQLYCCNITHFADMINNCCIQMYGKGNIDYISFDVCMIIIQYFPKIDETELLPLLKTSRRLQC